MKKTSPTIVLIVILAIGVLALGGLYAYLLHSLSNVGKRQQDFAVGIMDVNKIIEKETTNKERLQAYFLKEGEQADFVSNLESVCLGLSIRCDNRSLSESSDPTNVAKLLALGISAEGSFEGVLGLLRYFESSEYPIEVSGTQLSLKGLVQRANGSSTVEWEGLFEVNVPIIVGQ